MDDLEADIELTAEEFDAIIQDARAKMSPEERAKADREAEVIYRKLKE